MRLASFAVETAVGPARRLGVREDDRLFDVTAGYAHVLARAGEATPGDVAETIAPPEMTPFLQRGDRAMDAAREVAEAIPDVDAERGPDGARLSYDVDDVTLLAPVQRPNSLRDYMAFEKHVHNSLGEVPDVWYELPVCYKGNADEVVGPGDDVSWPSYSEQLDLELEIAAVIGKRGTDVDAEDADEYIAGYTLFNDFTARDTQLEEMQSNLGPAKGKDFANAFGPALVTPEEVELATAEFRVEVSGDTWSTGTVGEMGHSFAEIVEYASRAETLYPGDVLGSGTVGTGCGLELGRFLDPGDEVTIAVEGLGELTNRVVET